MSYYDEEYSLIAVLIGLVLIVVISLCYLSINSCTANNFENGIVVDKYRARHGVPHLIIEKNNDYGDIWVDEEAYLDYKIGEVYAQE